MCYKTIVLVSVTQVDWSIPSKHVEDVCQFVYQVTYHHLKGDQNPVT